MLLKRKIPISKVVLPDCSSIYPYLQDIKNDDASVGNRPLLAHLKSRFQNLFGTGDDTVSIMSNGSYALTNTLIATGAVAGKYCIMPSWCCPSIVYSVFYAGLKPFFVDVDSESWTLDAKKTLENLESIKVDVGAVMVPSSFGKSINVSKWDEFTSETKIPVVIDASNSFDSVLSKTKSAPSLTPIVMGFNTKSTLCFGEGGLVVCKDKKIIEKIERICKFGLSEQISGLFSLVCLIILLLILCQNQKILLLF
jgi:dTDP-4-amino-4,6-dideoxygalactose transaminase